jgi:hypothetical protein
MSSAAQNDTRKPNRKKARVDKPDSCDWTLAGNKHVSLAPLSEGSELTRKLAYVILDGLTVNATLDGEKDPEGVLVFDLSGQPTSVVWKGLGQMTLGKQLLYVGEPKGLIDVSVGMVESEKKDRKFWKDLGELSSAVAPLIAMAPEFGSGAAAGLGLVGAIAKLIMAGIRDDDELKYYGSISNYPSDSRDAIPLQQGKYQLTRKGDAEESPPDILIDFSVHGLKRLDLDDGDSIVVVLEKVVLDVRTKQTIAADDKLVIETKFSGGKGKKKKTQPFSFEQQFGGDKKLLEKTVGLQDKVLYRGPAAGFVSFSISVAVVKPSTRTQFEEGDENWKQLVTAAEKFATEVLDEDKEKVAEVSKTVETVRAAMIKLAPSAKKLFAAELQSLICGGNSGHAGLDMSGVFTVPDLEQWRPLQIELTDPKHKDSKVVMHLKVRKDG